MTAPPLAVYNKRPVQVMGSGAVDAEKMTRELGEIERAVRYSTNLARTVYNLFDYSADPRGVGDASAAFDRIWRAMDNADESGTVLVPRGTFRLTAPVVPTRSDVTIQGMGAGSVFTTDFDTTTDVAFYAQSLDRFTADGFTVGGAHAWAVFVSGGTGHVLTRLTLSGGTRLDGSGSKGGGIFVENASFVSVRRNVISGNGVADTTGWWDILFNYGTYQVTDSEILDNVCTSSVFCNIGGFDLRTTKVRRNTVRNAITPSGTPTTGGYGIMVYRNSGMAVGNVYGNDVSGNDISSTQGTGVYVQSSPHTTVEDNNVRDTCSTQTDASLTVAAIAIHDSSFCPVVGNDIDGSGQAGICFTSSTSTADFGVASGNTIRDVAKIGIAIRGAVADLAITGNTVTDCGRDAIGSYSDAAATRITVTGNTLRPNNSGGYRGIYASALTTDWTIGPNTISGTNGLPVDNRGTNNRVAWPEGVRNITATTTLDQSYATVTADATGGAITVNLPACAGNAGLKFTVIKTDASVNAVTLDGNGAETIDGAATYALTVQWQSVTVQTNGTAWVVVST